MDKPKYEYSPFGQIKGMSGRKWPSRTIDTAPVWCSVDLRDGNQALVNPMDLDEKLRFFRMLCDMGFKEIEVGFPSSNDTEYEILRALIDGDLIPEDVTVQVLTQCREHLIRRTFEAIDGAKNVIVHFYNATDELSRKVVFGAGCEEIKKIAVDAAALCRELAEQSSANIRFEYSPEHFSETEPGFIVDVCAAVMNALGATAQKPVIINLPATVERATPNIYADQVEYFCKHIPNRDAAIVSVHPHNDRGTGVADAELALLAGAQRVEGTLFGNGERTGNVDIITLALNMYTQGVEPGLDISDINEIRVVYEQCTSMRVSERQPYSGELVFTAFSGSHQDAVRKGFEKIKQSGGQWRVPYFIINPADIGRQYEPVVRINSQSGKGGAAFVMQTSFGYVLPRGMQPEFGLLVKHAADEAGRELTEDEVMEIFDREYLHVASPYSLKKHSISDSGDTLEGHSTTHFSGVISCHFMEVPIEGDGNGPIDAFFEALSHAGVNQFSFVSYHEHAIGSGSNAKAVAYIELRTGDGRHVYGVGVHNNTSIASIKGVICAINRAMRMEER